MRVNRQVKYEDPHKFINNKYTNDSKIIQTFTLGLALLVIFIAFFVLYILYKLST